MVLLYLPIVAMLGWLMANLLNPAVLLDLVALLYLTVVLVLGWIVTRKP